MKELYKRLGALGWIDPWLDSEKLLPGQDWNLEIETAVESTDVFIVVLSKGSVDKEGYFQRELRFAMDIALEKPEGTIFIIPLRLEELELPRRLRGSQTLDYFPRNKRPAAYKKLVESLGFRAIKLEKPKDLLMLEEELIREVPSNQIKPVEQRPEESIASNAQAGQDDLAYRTRERGQEVIEDVHKRDEATIKAVRQDSEKSDEISSAQKPTDSPTPKTMGREKITPQDHTIYMFGNIEFVKVSAGAFLMGSNDNDEDAYDDEKPQNPIDISYDYYIARSPVTNEQYSEYVKGLGIRHTSSIRGEKKHPVVEVSLNDVMAYCKWLNQRLESELPLGFRFSVPTEVEWEKAARGTTGLIYPWGNEFDKNKCNSRENGKGMLTPVGAYSPQGDSPYGCVDMAGNAREWTGSLLQPYPYITNDAREPLQKKGYRIVRGGSFHDGAQNVRSAYRLDLPRMYYNDDLGFRLVIVPLPEL